MFSRGLPSLYLEIYHIHLTYNTPCFPLTPWQLLASGIVGKSHATTGWFLHVTMNISLTITRRTFWFSPSTLWSVWCSGVRGVSDKVSKRITKREQGFNFFFKFTYMLKRKLFHCTSISHQQMRTWQHLDLQTRGLQNLVKIILV